MKNKTGYVYVRIASYQLSSVEKHNSIESQLNRCETYAKKNGYKILKTFRDKGKSGNTLQRSGLINLFTECDIHPVDAIIVDRVDRISRNAINFRKVRNILGVNEIKLISVSEGDMSPNTLISNIFASVAEWELEGRGKK